MMGRNARCVGAADPSLVEVETMPEEAAPEMPEEAEQEMLTQEDEETVAIKPKAEEKKRGEETRKERCAKAEEARKLAAEKRSVNGRQPKLPANDVAGAFGKGAQMGKGCHGRNRCAGSPTGNSSGRGNCRTGGYRTFNLADAP